MSGIRKKIFRLVKNGGVFVFIVFVFVAAFQISVPGQASALTCAPGEVEHKSFAGLKMCCPKKYYNTKNGSESCIIGKYVNPAIYGLSMIAGIAIIAGVIAGGIRYASSAGDPQKVTKAKASITHALIALVAFMLLGSFFQFFVPGGVTPSKAASTAKGGCQAYGRFIGLKTWYAYLPNNSFNPDCTVKDDVTVMPTYDSASGDRIPGVLPQIILAIADNLLRIAALVAVAFVMVGGVKYLTSQGQPNDTKTALSTIINALIGLAIALVAALIVNYIGGRLIL